MFGDSFQIKKQIYDELLDFAFHVCMFNFNLVHGRIEIVLQNAVGMNASV